MKCEVSTMKEALMQEIVQFLQGLGLKEVVPRVEPDVAVFHLTESQLQALQTAYGRNQLVAILVPEADFEGGITMSDMLKEAIAEKRKKEGEEPSED